MAARRPRLSPATVRAMERSAGSLATAARRHMSANLDWYRQLSAQDQSWVGLVAQAGIGSFISWLANPDQPRQITADVFGTAPRELTRAVTLTNALDLLRTVVDVIEETVERVAAPAEEAQLHMAVLYYSREVAFAAAQVYATAAESRGAWEARLESVVVDALVRGGGIEDAERLPARAAALGWAQVDSVCVLAADADGPDPDALVEAARRAVTRLGAQCLTAVHDRRLVLVVGGAYPPEAVAAAIQDLVGARPVVLGPTVTTLVEAGNSAAAALAGLRAVPAWPQAPRPVHAEDLLAERVLVADPEAGRSLVERVYRPLATAGGGLLETTATYLRLGGVLEATARELFVHPNTVRYRLAKVAQLTGYDPADPRDGHTMTLALGLGRLAQACAVSCEGDPPPASGW